MGKRQKKSLSFTTPEDKKVLKLTDFLAAGIKGDSQAQKAFLKKRAQERRDEAAKEKNK